MNIKYRFCKDGDYVPTKQRPSAERSAQLRHDLERHQEQGLVHQHAPGEGWHFLPGAAIIAFSGTYWFATRPSSEGSILAHVADICKEAGLDFEALWNEAYPQVAVPRVTAEDRKQCTRQATLQDLPLVLSDLVDINYHQLYKAVDKALR